VDTEFSTTDTATVSYVGRKKPLLRLALWTGFLTFITVGFYRFWARTRVRKYFWSAVTPDGTPLEYNGTGLEKFLGFLIAVAVLVVYLGIIQILLLFFGYSLFTQAETFAGEFVQTLMFYGVALVTLPLIYYAQYRARRYILSRTRWRGIRFGAEPAAWGYVLLALKNLLVTVFTLGILLPRQTFNLEKYRTDRSYFGDAQFHQGGDWRMLRPAMKQIYIAVGIMALAVVVFFSKGLPDFEQINHGDMEGMGVAATGAILFQLGVSWFYVGLAIYGVASWRIMANHKTLNGTVMFTSHVDTSDVIMAYVFGGLLAFIFALIAALIVGVAFGFIGSFIPIDTYEFDLDNAGPIIGFIAGYVAFLIFFGAVVLVAIRQPILRNYASSVVIHNASALNEIRQRAGDDFVEAEGFADALDVGAAF
tara:strand:+ start:1229 stop:2491 length:1263 start_codon:yes stop_codon:yes gene_type:complete